ncbi:hypothetical protein B7P43_G03797 [Cryptotermes secundus]|uniref:Uncharacterized protein n=1 Tax=Cryptotermes secundus TaxID=105785 RepID=A0A2J7Q4V6_9NEOP|nr:hypothetical protein B7P43_G03797 [Cryptotermes secundus]
MGRQSNWLYFIDRRQYSSISDVQSFRVAGCDTEYYLVVTEVEVNKAWETIRGNTKWLHDPSKINGDNLNNIRCKTSRHFRKERRIDELAMNKKLRDLYRGINYIKRGYQRRSNLVKDENGGLLVDSHNILNGWKNYFSQLLNVHRVSAVRQTEIHTAEPLVPDPNPLEVEIANTKLKSYKSPGSDLVLAELIQAYHCYQLCTKLYPIFFSQG